MTLINSLTSLTLDLPPSCVAFWPQHPELFVVGTYHLHRQEQKGDLSAENHRLYHKNGTKAVATETTLPDDDENEPSIKAEEKVPQKRTGSLILFHLNSDNDNITALSTTSTDFAILDIQWSPHHDPEENVLAVATSTGILAFYRLDACGSKDSSGRHVKGSRLVELCVKRIAEPETLVLSLAWHPTKTGVLGVTLSDGRVCLCTSTSEAAALWNEGAKLRISDVHEHSLEAWTLAFNSHAAAPGQVLSGGDDVVLQCSHLPSNHEETESSPLWQDRKLHQAGITAILPLSDTLVVTGSYDDHIRLLSLPAVGRKQCLAELNLGGGVWRLKVLQGDDASSPTSHAGFDPSSSSLLLLASCMHAGTRIVKLIQEDEWRFEVLARFEEHDSMNYGSDVQLSSEKGMRKKRIVSTSFYDKLMCLWEWKGDDV